MKKPFVAFLLSFIIPGAGLAYVGRWKHAFLNIAVVLAIGIVLAVCLPEATFHEYIRYVAYGISGGSAALAQQAAQQHNAKIATDGNA
jgi:hypothetical protein